MNRENDQAGYSEIWGDLKRLSQLKNENDQKRGYELEKSELNFSGNGICNSYENDQ